MNSLPMCFDAGKITQQAAKLIEQNRTPADIQRSRQSYLSELPVQLDRIKSNISHQTERLDRYSSDVSEIDGQIETIEAAMQQLEPLAPTHPDVRSRISSLTQKVGRLIEARGLAADAVTASQRILDDNKGKLSEFDHAGLAEFLATEKILATVNL